MTDYNDGYCRKVESEGLRNTNHVPHLVRLASIKIEFFYVRSGILIIIYNGRTVRHTPSYSHFVENENFESLFIV